MKHLLENLEYEREWRLKELSILLNLLDFLKSSEGEGSDQFRVLSKYIILAIYATWEGFVKDALKIYSSFINRSNDFKVDMTLKTHIIIHNGILDDLMQKKINANIDNLNFKKNLLMEIKDVFDNPSMPNERPKTPILRFRDTNKLLDKFNLKHLNEKYELKLDALVRYRNSFAHGESYENIDYYRYIQDYNLMIKNLINELIINIKENCTND